jgi:Tol biopolymer transport system component
LPWIVAAVFALAAATLAGVALRRPAGARNAMRVAVLPPAGASIDQDERNTVISPDGTKLVFAAVDTSGTNQLWVHDLASSIAQPLPGTGHAFLPFWSPDSRSIAFFADGKLKRVDVAGKEVQTVCLAPDGRGGAWSPNGIILFAPLSAGGLMSVPESGGQPAPAVAPDTTLGEGALRFPCFLPDGRRFLFVALDRGDEWSIKLGRLGEHTSRPVFRADGAAVFAAPDRVLYPRRGVLLAQRFDAARGRLTGEPHTIGPSPGVTQYAGSPPASVSRTGMLAQRNRSLRPLGLAWLGRDGRWAGEVAIAPDLFSDLRLSGDDTRAALIHTSPDGDTDLWSVDLARGLATRLTSDLVACERPLWSPDGRWIVCSAFVRATRCLFRRLASGGGNAEILWRSPGAFTDPVAWSPDGTTIFLRDLDSVTGENVWTLRADGKSPWQPLLNSRFHELDPRLSPDGRWLAYRSDESGRAELYVQSYPSPDVKQRVSTDGCGAQTRARVTGPFWRRDGRELLFVSGDGLTVMAASVESGTTLNIGTPRPLFRLPPGCREIEASSTGDRFLVLEDRSGAEGEAIHLLVNWPAAERER